MIIDYRTGFERGGEDGPEKRTEEGSPIERVIGMPGSFEGIVGGDEAGSREEIVEDIPAGPQFTEPVERLLKLPPAELGW